MNFTCANFCGSFIDSSNPFSLKKQIVKYGHPGTGKTYQTGEQTELLFNIWKEKFVPTTANSLMTTNMSWYNFIHLSVMRIS